MPIPYLLLYLFISSYTAAQGLGRENLPYYTEVPSTSFRCEDQQFAGYYSDPEAECQLFHICVRRNNILEQYSFLCPNETVFDQENMVCVWWDGFECSTASSLYYVNQDIFEDSQEDERGKQFFDDENLDQERFLRRPRGRAAFQKGNQITSSKTLIENISARNALGKSFTSDVRSLTQNTRGFSKDVGKATKAAKLPIINSIGSAKSENLHYRSPDKLTTAKSFHFPTSGKSKKRPLSLQTKEELNDRSKTTNRNLVLNSKQLTNSIAILPFTQLTSPFQISVPVGKPKLETSITNHSFTKSNSDKKFKFNSTKELKSTSAPRLYNKQVPTEKRADISSKKEKKLSKNFISEQFPNFGNLKKDQINSNTRRPNYVQTKSISRVSGSKSPHKKLSKEKIKQTVTLQPPRSYLPTTRTTSNRRIKKPVSEGKEKSFSRNKSVKAFRSSVSKGISSYDILHQLLKNVTVIRSEKIARLNRGFGRSFKRNKRLNKDHFNSEAKFEDKILQTIDIKLADTSDQIEKKSSTNFLKSTSKCIFDCKTKTFTGCSSKMSDVTKLENIKKEPSSNAETSSYLFHSFTNSAAEKTITSPTLQKVRKLKKGLPSRGKKKFSVDKFFDPMKLGFNQLSK